jgi:2-polyprenyl-6-methoxyphenol hydroxylase-like FAD-dependent oxidoreductase
MTGQLAAAVAGGGVAGLTAAVSLAQAGWKVRVLERASAFGEVGAGLALTANAMAAFSAVGLAEAVRRAGHTDYADGFQDLAGRWLMRRPGDRADLRAIATLCGIHRQRLHAVLLQAAQSTPDIDLITGAAVTSVRPGTAGGARAQVCWQEAGAERCAGTDLIVAADGMRSAVRAQLFPGVRPRYSGSTRVLRTFGDFGGGPMRSGRVDRFILREGSCRPRPPERRAGRGSAGGR